MTLPAGFGDIRSPDRGARILSAQNAVRAVAIGANRSGFALGDSLRVNAFQIGLYGAYHGYAEFFAELGTGMAGSAGCGKPCSVHRGIRVGMAKNTVNVSVTTAAVRRLSHALSTLLAMDTLLVARDLLGVASGAVHGGQFLRVRIGFDSRVAEAATQGSVGTGGKLLRVHRAAMTRQTGLRFLSPPLCCDQRYDE